MIYNVNIKCTSGLNGTFDLKMALLLSFLHYNNTHTLFVSRTKPLVERHFLLDATLLQVFPVLCWVLAEYQGACGYVCGVMPFYPHKNPVK